MKNILITGAASGLGKALAQYYANLDFRVLVVDIQDAIGQEFVAKLQADGKHARYYHCDIGSTDDIQQLYNNVSQEFNCLDILINNAGIAAAGTIEETSIDQWQRLLNLDLTSLFFTTKTFLPLLKQPNQAHVVNIASYAALVNYPGMMAYNVAKAGVVAFSESLAVELSPFAIGVSVACPAFFKTNLLDSMPNASHKTKNYIANQMQKSDITANHIAADIAKAIENNTFMVISHKQANRQYSLKRLFPNAFLKKKIKFYKRFLKG